MFELMQSKNSYHPFCSSFGSNLNVCVGRASGYSSISCRKREMLSPFFLTVLELDTNVILTSNRYFISVYFLSLQYGSPYSYIPYLRRLFVFVDSLPVLVVFAI